MAKATYDVDMERVRKAVREQAIIFSDLDFLVGALGPAWVINALFLTELIPCPKDSVRSAIICEAGVLGLRDEFSHEVLERAVRLWLEKRIRRE